MGSLHHLAEIIKIECGCSQEQADDIAYFIIDDVDALIKNEYSQLYETEDDDYE